MTTPRWTAPGPSTTPRTWKRCASCVPGRTPPTKEQWLLRNFHGIMEYLEGDLGMTREELAREMEIWRGWTTSHVPPFFPGFLELLADYRRHGGLVAVISHSEVGVIEGHYRSAARPAVRPGPHLRVGTRCGKAEAQHLARAGSAAAIRVPSRRCPGRGRPETGPGDGPGGRS